MNNKTQYQCELLGNRLSKRYKHLKKWAKRSNVNCFRLYDKDIPEIPLAIDLYETETSMPGETGTFYVQVALYKRPYEKDQIDENLWLEAMKNQIAFTLSVPQENIVIKTRQQQKGENQYEKLGDKKLEFIVKENGLRFLVNLSDYIDTGLFFDHRPLRKKVQQTAEKKSVLNLFCYTGAFSVYAASGKAKSVTSVDLSKKYLDWAKNNLKLNGYSDEAKYQFVASDVKTFLENDQNQYDIIVLDPPTFSNSKKTETTLDINRDWPELVGLCCKRLSKNGILYFSTNSRKIRFEEDKLPVGFFGKEITDSTIPEDFRNMKIHQAWEIKSGEFSSDLKFVEKGKSQKVVEQETQNTKTEKIQEIRY